MKIKNDLVSIKIGNKHYDFNNLILDEYLKIFATAQLDKDTVKNIKKDKEIEYLLIKFDTPISNLNAESVLKNEDFDIVLIFSTIKTQTLSENTIIAQYIYTSGNDEIIKDYNDSSSQNHFINEYVGKKITALGFNSYWTDSSFVDNPVKAVLDTSNYNIYIQENQDFTVIRKDIITTDTLFYSNDKEKVAGPLHLAPIWPKAVIEPTKLEKQEGNVTYIKSGADESYGIIYSIGLSSTINSINKEYIIGQDIQVEQNNAELTFEGLDNRLTESNYTFVIIKYKVWQNILSGTYDNPIYTMTDTGYFYHQAIPIKLFGDLNLKIKYERE